MFFFSFYTNNIYIGLNANHLQLNNLILASSNNCIKIGQNKLDINPEEFKKKKNRIDNNISKSLTKLWKLAGKPVAIICLSKPKLKSLPAEKIRSDQICTTEPWDGPGIGAAGYFRSVGAEQT